MGKLIMEFDFPSEYTDEEIKWFILGAMTDIDSNLADKITYKIKEGVNA